MAFVSEQEYLQHYTNLSDEKYEYINGEIWAMAGALWNHAFITGNILGNLYPKFKDKKCKAFVRDWCVQCKHNYYYPDVVIDCDSTRNENQAGQPVVIFEVLSESIRAVDLTIKLNDYRQIPTLEAWTKSPRRNHLPQRRQLESRNIRASRWRDNLTLRGHHFIACRYLRRCCVRNPQKTFQAAWKPDLKETHD